MRIKSALPHFLFYLKNQYEKILNNIKKLINYIDENNLIFCSFVLLMCFDVYNT